MPGNFKLTIYKRQSYFEELISRLLNEITSQHCEECQSVGAYFRNHHLATLIYTGIKLSYKSAIDQK